MPRPYLFRALRGVLLAGVLLGLSLPAQAQQDASVGTGSPDVRLRFGGIIQSRVSYGWTTGGRDAAERVGFGVRRARLRAVASVGPRAGLHLFIEGAGGTLQMLDAFFFYQINERLRLRLGRMASAQPRALIPTGAAQVDAVDRMATAERWGRGTIGGDGRDFGIDVQYRSPRGEALLFVHNGDGDWSRLRSNARESISSGSATAGVDRPFDRLAVSFSSALRPAPGVEVGGFVGYNGSENPNTVADDRDRGRTYASYAAHVYWGAEPGSQTVRLKADVIGLRYEGLSGTPGSGRDQQTLGLALLGAVRVHRGAELFARVERYDPSTAVDGPFDVFVTAGASLSLSALRGQPYARERLTLAYEALAPDRSDDDAVQHLVVLQAQLAF